MPSKLPPISRHSVVAPTEEQGSRLAGARSLPIASVEPNPWQPRQHADEERMQELIEDIAARGILQPLVVRPAGDGKYQVVAGERRYRAAVAAGLDRVPAIVRDDMTEEQAREASLVENLLREDLDIEDEARFIQALYEQKKSLRAVGEAIHKSYQYVNRRLKLLESPETLLAYRKGLVDLDSLIAGNAQQGAGGSGDLPMDEASSVTARNSEESGSEDARLEEVRFYRTRSAFKPFQKLHLHVQGLTKTPISQEERPRLRQTVRELIEELSRFEQALQDNGPPSESNPHSDEPDIELEPIEDRQAWTVRRAGSGD